MEKSDDEEFVHAPGKRWDPLGADDENLIDNADHRLPSYEIPDHMCDNEGSQYCNAVDTTRIRNLEEEQEILTTSLMALTSHFAQVQFRLRQIVDAPATQRDQLLKSLEEFAFRGIPEVTGNVNVPESGEVIANLERARSRQFELIDRLKKQLTELENFAYESGAPVLPQSIIFEKQKIIIDELKNKLNLNVNDFDLPQLSSEDIKSQVDTAIGEFVGPLKMKEQLVTQLKTQITDLERFIAFLQHSDGESQIEDTTNSVGGRGKNATNAYNSYSAKIKHGRSSKNESQTSQPQKKNQSNGHENYVKTMPENSESADNFSSKTHSLLSKASTLLQMFAVTQFGCGSSSSSSQFKKNTLKKTSQINHWGDTRAQLEVDIQEVVALAMTLQNDRKRQQSHEESESNMPEQYDAYLSDSDEEGNRFMHQKKTKPSTNDQDLPNFSLTNVELTTVVRKNLAVTLQKLIQHGLRSDITLAGSSLVPFIGCFQTTSHFKRNYYGNSTAADEDEYQTRSDEYRGQMHAWELIMHYYMVKNGEDYNETPSRKLSQSFNLEIVGHNATISNKQGLLSTIGTIIALHKPYKRSYNSHFKAFVCAALNSKKLVVWLNLIFQCNELINAYYLNWSYVAQTGFRDALHSLDNLTKFEFDLPIDLAVRQFQNIKDVFM